MRVILAEKPGWRMQMTIVETVSSACETSLHPRVGQLVPHFIVFEFYFALE